jgi:hypothetical protein
MVRHHLPHAQEATQRHRIVLQHARRQTDARNVQAAYVDSLS